MFARMFAVRMVIKWTRVDDLICTFLRGDDAALPLFPRLPTSSYSLPDFLRRALRSVFTATLTARSSMFVNVLGNVRVDSVVPF